MVENMKKLIIDSLAHFWPCHDEYCPKKHLCRRYKIDPILFPTLRRISHARDRNDDEAYCTEFVEIQETDNNIKEKK